MSGVRPAALCGRTGDNHSDWSNGSEGGPQPPCTRCGLSAVLFDGRRSGSCGAPSHGGSLPSRDQHHRHAMGVHSSLPLQHFLTQDRELSGLFCSKVVLVCCPIPKCSQWRWAIRLTVYFLQKPDLLHQSSSCTFI